VQLSRKSVFSKENALFIRVKQWID